MAPKACWGPHQLQLRLKRQSHCLIFTDCAKRCEVYYSSDVPYYFHHSWIITVTTWNEVSLTGTICAMLLTITPTTDLDKCSRTVQNFPLIKTSWSWGKWSNVIREFAASWHHYCKSGFTRSLEYISEEEKPFLLFSLLPLLDCEKQRCY